MRGRLHLFHARSPTLAPLQSADYRRLLSSNFLWWLARFMEVVAMGWLVLELTDSAWMVAVIGFFRSLPLILFGFFGGSIIDRFGRRPVILASQSATFAVYASLTLLLASGRLALWHLAVGAFILGCAWSIDWPARRALLPDLVGKAHTVDAMLLENFAQSCARMLGPWAGGVLLATQGATGCFVLLAIVSGVTLLNLWPLSQRTIERSDLRPSASPWSMLGESLRYAGRSQPILGVLLITLIVNMLLMPYMTLLPVFARDVLGRGPVGLGLLAAAAGVGSFAGLLVINRLRRSVSNGSIFIAGTLGLSVTLLVFSQSTFYPLSWLMLLFAGIGQACFGTMQSSIILLGASDEMRSRTMGLVVLAIGGGPLGQLQTGALAESYGAPFALSLQAVMAGVLIAVIGVKLPGLRQQSLVRTVGAPVAADE